MARSYRIKIILLVALLVNSRGFANEQDLRRAFKDIKVLVVPGFVAEDQTLARWGFQLYANLVKTLRTIGLEAELSSAPAGGRIEVTTPILRREIDAAPKKVFLVGHSFGGNKVLRAAVEAPPATFRKIAGLMLVQSPLHGSVTCKLGPVPWLVDMNPKVRQLEKVHRDCLNVIDPSGLTQALALLPYGIIRDIVGIAADIDPVAAENFLSANADRIVEISHKLPLLTVSSAGPSLMFGGLQMILNLLGHENDGVIETPSQRLATGIHRYVHLDHLQLILQSRRHRETWISLFQAVAPSL